jgi:CelD/BcsL family acetyltransferase involved in cellulose biosynthesis
MEIRLVESEEEFHLLREEWNQILSKSLHNCFFLTWEWVYTWWKKLKGERRLFILLAIDEEKIVGIAPFIISSFKIFKVIKIKVINFLAQGEPADSDYLDFIILPDYVEVVLENFVDYLKRVKNDWDAINLCDILDSSPYISHFCKNLRKKNLSFKVTHIPEGSPYIVLPSSWEDYLKSIGYKTRYNLRKFDRKLKKDYQVEFKKIEDKKEIEENFYKFIEMHEKRWEEKGEFDYFLMPSFDQFNLEVINLALEKGWLEFYVLLINNREAGYLYGFNYDKKIYGYQASFDSQFGRYGLGMLQISYWIKNSIEKGLKEFHFLSGDEPHKFKFTKISKRCISILVRKRNISGILLALEMNIYLFKAFLSKKIKSSEFLSRLVRRIKVLIKGRIRRRIYT